MEKQAFEKLMSLVDRSLEAGIDLSDAESVVVNNFDDGFTVEYGGKKPFYVKLEPIALLTDDEQQIIAEMLAYGVGYFQEIVYEAMKAKATVNSLIGAMATISGLLSSKIQEEERKEQ